MTGKPRYNLNFALVCVAIYYYREHVMVVVSTRWSCCGSSLDNVPLCNSRPCSGAVPVVLVPCAVVRRTVWWCSRRLVHSVVANPKSESDGLSYEIHMEEYFLTVLVLLSFFVSTVA